MLNPSGPSGLSFSDPSLIRRQRYVVCPRMKPAPVFGPSERFIFSLRRIWSKLDGRVDFGQDKGMRTAIFVVGLALLWVPVGVGQAKADDIRTPIYVQEETAEPFQRLAQVRTSRDASALELAFWSAIKDSNNPADFQAYLEAFPEGAFVPLARIRAQSGGALVEDVDLAYVALVAANVRAQPTADSERVGALTQGTRIKVTGRASGGSWLRIAMNDGGAGFVFGELLKPLATTPDVDTPPATPATLPTQPQVATAAPRAAAPSVRSAEARSSFQDCGTCPEMVVLAGGSFTMGNDKGDKSQRPARQVRIGREFAIGRYEVTVGEWRACANSGGCGDLPSPGHVCGGQSRSQCQLGRRATICCLVEQIDRPGLSAAVRDGMGVRGPGRHPIHLRMGQ